MLRHLFRVKLKSTKATAMIRKLLYTLREILRELDNRQTEEDLDGIIAEVDEDGFGTLDFHEDDEGRFGAILVNYRQTEEIPSVLSAGIPHMRHEKSGSWIQDSLTTSEQPSAVKWHP
ncbi:Troponin C, isotype gamma [Portunus trituberculatus]|uniref:Troponin C, isotype gamma n=1 Tax=Portunus trituberculatus TaxID=210409 RepID=A0A5B7EK32_PORTR|nr:Troponin C, isotype gamma [Portunus trituberculatus]